MYWSSIGLTHGFVVRTETYTVAGANILEKGFNRAIGVISMSTIANPRMTKASVGRLQRGTEEVHQPV